MILQRYGGNLSIFEMLSFGQANELIQTALEAEQTDFTKLRWAITGERLGYDWDEFCSKLKKKNSEEPERSAEEILDGLENIMTAVGW